MKKNVFLFLSLLISIYGSAQKTPKTAATKQVVQTQVKYDHLMKLNGEELVGKVTEINDNDVKFVHEGETLVYAIKKQDIMKINYSSGRIEFYNKLPLPSEKKESNTETKPQVSGPADHVNKVAILPFHYTVDKQRVAEEMSETVQSECYTYLKNHSLGLTILDPRTTDALLVKAGINFDNIKGYTMDELANILGVEYIVEGRITQTRTGQVSSQSSSFNDKYNYNYDNGRNRGSTYSSSTTTQRYQTKMTMNIFTDKNANIFTMDKTSIWATDTYKSTLQYILKRTPLYKK